MARYSSTTPHDDDDGFVQARAHPLAEGYVVLYDGVEAGFDNTDVGRWSVFCPVHGSMCAETSKARAQKLLASPDQWCAVCGRIKSEKDGFVQMRVVSFSEERSPEVKDREKRFWAKKSKNSPEKQKLFEKMYGVSPDEFWD